MMKKIRISKKKSKTIVSAICSLIFCMTLVLTNVLAFADDGVNITTEKTPIMGQPVMSRGQAFTFLRERNEVKTDVYIEEFVQFVWEEAKIEGIRPDVAFCQMMLETGFLKFGGDVKEEQNNFAGIGATGGGNPGNSFPSIRIGIRAVIQHLKAYASKEPLKQECVDPRYHLVTKGCAPNVEDLSGKWAVGMDYGSKIIKLINTGKELVDHQAVSALKDISVIDTKTQERAEFGNLFNNKEYYISAKAESTNRPLYKFWIKNNKTGEVKILANYSESNKVLWKAPANTDYYSIGVSVKDKYSLPEIEVQDQWDRNVKVIPGKAAVSTIAIYNGNKRVNGDEVYKGMDYTLRATAKADTEVLYQFLIKDLNTNKWSVLREFSNSNNYQWKVSSNPDNYVLGVRVKDKHGNEGVVDEEKSVGITIKNLSGKIDSFGVYSGNNKVTEVNSGDTYTLKATVSGMTKPMYRFWMKDLTNGTISILNNYSGSSEFKFTANSSSEEYILGVDVRGDGMTTNQKFTEEVKVKVNSNGAKLQYFNSYLGDMEITTGAHVPGVTYTLKANATSTNRPMYQFWIKDLSTNKWTKIKDYSYENTCEWTAPKTGTDYWIGVHIKDEKSSREFDDHKYIPIKVYQVEVPTAKKKIVLDAGHGNKSLKTGGVDSGAVGFNGIKENELTTTYAQKLGPYLEKLGYEVIYTSDYYKGYNEVSEDLQQRVDVANSNKADLFLSIHFNSFSSASVGGVEAYYSSVRPNNSDAITVANESKKVASTVLDAVSKLGLNNRGVKDKEFYVVKNTTMPSLLLEAGFITNPEEVKKLTDGAFQDNMIKAIGDAVKSYLGK